MLFTVLVFYCIKGPEGWRKSFCPKRSTLTSLAEWEGPFATELEMVSVLNIKKKEKCWINFIILEN